MRLITSINLIISGFEFKIREEDKMDESSTEDLYEKRDFRKKKEKKRSHKSKEKDECSRENFKKMRQELDDLRRKEDERAKELERLKKQISMNEYESTQQSNEEIEYALGFTRDEYLGRGFIESAQWIKNEVAKEMIEQISLEENRVRFEAFMITKKASTHMGIRTCARYNRGEECTLGKWHATHKTDNVWACNDARHGIQTQRHADRVERTTKRNELRLHACTLCAEALMSINGHSVLNCPWILKKNWNV